MKQKNVIWILGDQHRAQALSCNGDPNVNTPNIDRLAAEGVNFRRAVSGFPLCCPFRGSMLTSRYPHHCVPGHEYPMPDGQPTIAHVFDAHGYDTAYFGKWHLDGFHESEGRAAFHIVPPARRGGFKTWIGYENNNSPWDCWVHGGESASAFHRRLHGYETDCLADLLIEEIRRHASGAETESRPFFAVLSVQPPHDPYIAPPGFMARHNPQGLKMRPNVPDVPRIQEQARRELAGAYAQIENLDWNIGRIREALAEAEIDKDTHIVFFSDHGDMHGSHGQFRKMTPHEESIRVPFIIGGCTPMHYEGFRCGGTAAPINHVDIAPTTLGLCGIDAPDWMSGFDYSGWRVAARPRGAAPDSAFIQSVVPTRHGNSVDEPWRAVVTEDGWKYVCLEGRQWLMFNLDEDPFEQVNLAFNSLYRARRKILNARLAQWVADTGDTFALPTLP